MAGKSRSQRNRGAGGGPSKGAGGGRGRGDRSRSRRPATNRQYPRTARLNTLLHEIVADFFERIDDERFEMLTITGVEVDNDLNRAQVYVSALGTVGSNVAESTDGAPPVDWDRELVEALADYRKPVQAKIGREARIRKTPEVVFAVDPAVRSGARIDQILASLSDQQGDVDDESDE